MEETLPCQEPPEPPGGRHPLPHHSQQNGTEQRCDEEAEQRLNVIHDAAESHDEVSGADGDDDAQNRTPASHADVVFVRSGLADERAVNVIGPHRGESAHVARHSRHEPGDERGDAESQQPRATIARQHQRQDFVVAVLADPHRAFGNSLKGSTASPSKPGRITMNGTAILK